MTTTQALQNLQDEFRKAMDHAKTTQSCLQQLKNAKREAEISKKRHEALTVLKIMQNATERLQEHMKSSQDQIETALGEKPDPGDSSTTEDEDGEKGQPKKQQGIKEISQMSPEQQEVLYELKASRMGALQSKNQALRKELSLNLRKKHLLGARHAQTQAYSGSETLRAAHALEAKVRGANLKIKGLEEELRKSQHTALRYRELYEDSQRQSEADRASKAPGTNKSSTHRAKTAPSANDSSRGDPPQPKAAPLKEQSFVGPNTNVNDVVRKNECLLEENEVQRREIHRLKNDNAQLILVAKTAAAHRDTVFARLGTSESARHDLQKRHLKLKNENSQLSRSFTRQAAYWIDGKKQQQHVEAIERWGEIYPVAPHGGKERFFSHGQKENTSLPKQMYPVESYGGTSTV